MLKILALFYSDFLKSAVCIMLQCSYIHYSYRFSIVMSSLTLEQQLVSLLAPHAPPYNNTQVMQP